MAVVKQVWITTKEITSLYIPDLPYDAMRIFAYGGKRAVCDEKFLVITGDRGVTVFQLWSPHRLTYLCTIAKPEKM
jgi:hypothetical protein